MALHRDPSVWGPNPDKFDPENFSREAEAARPINAWKPFGNGQRACIGRGFAMHEAALAIGMILQRFKLIDITSLSDAPEGDADDQARRLQDQGAAARGQGARRVCRPCGGSSRCVERGGTASPDASGAQHAAIGALWLEPRLRGRIGNARRRFRRGQRLRDKTGAARRLRRQAAGAGRRPDLLRVLQWRATGQRHAIRQMAGRRFAQRCVRKGPLRGVRLRQQRLGRDLPVGAAHDRRAIGRARRAQPLSARRGRCPQRSRRPVRKMVCGGSARGDEGIRCRFDAQPQRRRCAALYDTSRSRRQRSTPSSRRAAFRR